MNTILPFDWFKSIIDINDAKCLYCHTEGEFFYELKYQYGEFKCKTCNESYRFWMKEEVAGFDFTCNVFIFSYRKNNTYNSYVLLAKNKIITIPFFVPDFSDKNKLLDKIKLILTFQ